MSLSSTASDQTIIESGLRHSRYLQRLAQSNPPLLEELHNELHTPWNAETMRAALAVSEISDEAGLKSALRMLRKRVMLRLIARDIGGLSDLNEVMMNASQLAEVTIIFSLDHLAGWMGAQYGHPIGEESGGIQDLIVVGMGKLGGGELNVSSDIDLIFAYPEEGETSGPRHVSNHEYLPCLARN